MAQRLVERFVAVGQIDVFADHGDAHRALRVLQRVHQLVPALQPRRRGVEAQLVADQAVEPLLVQQARHLVDAGHVGQRDHAPQRHVGKEADFFALVVGDGAVGAAQQGVGLDADFAHFLHRVLGRLGFELARRRDPRHVAQMHEGALVRPQAQTHLAHRLQEGQRFDVAHGAADFDDRHLHRLLRTITGAAFDELLDFVGDVRNHLHRFAEVVAAALFFEHAFVDLAGGEVVGALHAGFDEALVVAEVEVGFGPVVGDEHLAVLKRAHGAGIDVEVGVELDQGDVEAARFEQRRQRSGRDALAK